MGGVVLGVVTWEYRVRVRYRRYGMGILGRGCCTEGVV